MCQVVEIAWAAGLFEGEGSIGLTARDLLPRLRISMTDRDVLDRFCTAVTAGSVSGPYAGNGSKTPTGRKPMYVWQANGIVDVSRILDAFWPYLGERRRAKANEITFRYFVDGPEVRVRQFDPVRAVRVAACACGCGHEVCASDARGRPRKFVRGHNHRKAVATSGPATWDAATGQIVVTGQPTMPKCTVANAGTKQAKTTCVK